jgi:3-methyladenine DNA glycosylase AlkD
MELREVLAELEALSTEQNRKTYRRHGFSEPIYGVSFANLGLLKRRIKKDQALAEALWATRAYEAQQLAVMISEADAFTSEDLDRWAQTANSYGCVDALAKDIVIRTPFGTARADAWIASPDDTIERAGWATVGCLAISEPSLPDGYFREFLPRIESTIHQSSNRIKEAMNSALIAIGSRNEVLRGTATETAARIGKVRIDHGETNCKTPDAVVYIEKSFARKAARASA